MNNQQIEQAIKHLQSNIDKRGFKIKSLWDIQNSYEEYRKQVIIEAPDCIGYWEDRQRLNMKSISSLAEQQKLEKKMLFHFIGTMRYQKYLNNIADKIVKELKCLDINNV